MKRLNNLYAKICSLDNLQLADSIARKGKSGQYGVQAHDKNRDANILALQKMLIDKTYSTSEYKIFKIYEPKERDVYGLPYFPDRIAHHAIMNVLEPIFVSTFTSDSYSCIKGKGIHAALYSLKSGLQNVSETTYCLKLDITKFYPNVDHKILKRLIRRKIKDNDLLWLLDEIIDSAPGIPIGNYLSQYFANYYLTGFDHWIKEIKRIKYYYRYADDLVILCPGKPELHQTLSDIRNYLNNKLNLTIKGNYQVFPVDKRGIDFVGYVSRHTHIRIRKSIKQSFARAIAKGAPAPSLASYRGWAKHCNSRNLMRQFNEKIQRLQHHIKPGLPGG